MQAYEEAKKAASDKKRQLEDMQATYEEVKKKVKTIKQVRPAMSRWS